MKGALGQLELARSAKHRTFINGGQSEAIFNHGSISVVNYGPMGVRMIAVSGWQVASWRGNMWLAGKMKVLVLSRFRKWEVKAAFISSRGGAWDALEPHQRLPTASDCIADGCPCRGSVGSGSLVCHLLTLLHGLTWALPQVGLPSASMVKRQRNYSSWHTYIHTCTCIFTINTLAQFLWMVYN